MGVFALGFFVPVLVYCVVQTIRDFRSRHMMMWAWGMIITALIIMMTSHVVASASY